MRQLKVILLSAAILLCMSACQTAARETASEKSSTYTSEAETVMSPKDISEQDMLSLIKDITQKERPLSSTYLDEVSAYLQNKAVAYGYQNEVQSFEYNNNHNELIVRNLNNPEIFFEPIPQDAAIDGQGQNIIIHQDSAEITAPTLIISAHYDSHGESLGVNDNASGIAVLYEIARILKDESLPFNIQYILFSGEEQWMVGSRWYVSHLTEDEKKNIIGNINIDSIAAKSDLGYWIMLDDFQEITDEDSFDIIPIDNKLSLLLDDDERFSLYAGFNSDHHSFALADIPAVSIVQDLSDDIAVNSDQDTYDKIDSNRLVEVTNALLKLIHELE